MEHDLSARRKRKSRITHTIEVWEININLPTSLVTT